MIQIAAATPGSRCSDKFRPNGYYLHWQPTHSVQTNRSAISFDVFDNEFMKDFTELHSFTSHHTRGRLVATKSSTLLFDMKIF